MNTTQYLTISTDESVILQTVFAVQGDFGGRQFVVTMLEDYQQIIPASGDTAKFRFRKPDNTGNWESATINNDGTIAFTTSAGTLIMPGMMYCDVAIVNGDNVLSTATFAIYCEAAPMDSSEIVSSDEFLFLQQTIIEALKSIRSMKELEVSAEHLEPGTLPTVEVTGGEDGEPFSIAFGIPEGEKGEQGDTYVLTQSDKQDIADLIGYETQLRYITMSTADPSGGNNGDIWIKYV